MKRFLYLLTVVAFVMACDTEKVDGPVLGPNGYSYDEIYIRMDEGMAVAHGQILTYSCNMVDTEIEFVSYGMSDKSIQILEGIDDVSLVPSDGFPYSEEYLWPTWNHEKTYRQTLRLTIQPNLSGHSRTARYRILVAGPRCSAGAAEITIIQQGRQ